MRHILDEFQHVALANPQIAFSLYQNELEVFGLPAGKLSQRIVALLGNGYKEQLAACEEVTHSIAVKGFVGKPESSKKSRGDQFFFVNNRFIRSAYLNHAVLAAYEGLLARDTHPFYVLFLELDPKSIDINVHPTKTEIKFEDEKTVYAVVRAAVKQSLGLHNIAPSLDFDGDVNFAPIRPLRAGKGPGGGPTEAADHLPAATPAARAADADGRRPDALAAACLGCSAAGGPHGIFQLQRRYAPRWLRAAVAAQAHRAGPPRVGRRFTASSASPCATSPAAKAPRCPCPPPPPRKSRRPRVARPLAPAALLRWACPSPKRNRPGPAQPARGAAGAAGPCKCSSASCWCP
jgi:hypothetical protein